MIKYITLNINIIKNFLFFLKKNCLSILFCIFTLCLIIFSQTNIVAIKNALVLWSSSVVPSIFPFLVATEMLSHTNIIQMLSKWLTPIIKPLFGIPGECAFAFIMGLLSGYPVGAKIVSNFVQDNVCSIEDAEKMIAFTNNSGPLFIIGTVGISIFKNINIGILLFITHILACISVGILFNLIYKKNSKNTLHSTTSKSTPPFSSLGKILGDSIKNAISTILVIGGFIIIFSIIISILNQTGIINNLSNILSSIFKLIGIPYKFIPAILSGIIELTTGVSLITNISMYSLNISIIISAFLLGFGGLSVMFQVFSIVSKNNISIKKYAIGKFLQGIFAAIYTLITLHFFDIV